MLAPMHDIIWKTALEGAFTFAQLWIVKTLGQRPTSPTSGEGFPRVACVHLLLGYVMLEKVEENSLGSLLTDTLISIS